MKIIISLDITQPNVKMVNLIKKNLMWDVANFSLNKVFEWGYLKEKVYSREPETLEELENFFHQEINNIPHKVFLNVIHHFQVRLCYKSKQKMVFISNKFYHKLPILMCIF